MKKLLTISILFVMILAMCTSMVCATTKAELADQLYTIGSKYGATAADKIRVERFVADNNLTDAQATAIVAKANEIAAVFNNAGVTSYSQLTAAQKAQVKALANEAASIAGVTLLFTNGNVSVYKDGKLIDSTTLPVYAAGNGSSNAAVATSGARLVYTGSNSYAIVIGSAVVALATAVIVRKKVVNA